jgi:oligopeptide/dipeptide ABC transporter ATP-binding protein
MTQEVVQSNLAELVRVENLRVHFAVRGGRLRQKQQGIIRAVDGVSFSLRQGETLGLVGAANCGKTTLARAVALLDRPTAGRVFFQGQALTALRGRRLKRAQRRIQMLFSDPYVAFAPRMTVEKIITEALNLGMGRRGRQRDQHLADLMDQVGLNLYLAVRYPRELSGGNRQRVALARALAAGPSLLVCDQWTAHLDPALGRDLIDLLHEQNQRSGVAVLLTARRLETARHADRVAAMVMGRIVEMGYYADLVRQPLHPFTRAMLRSRPGDSLVTDAALDPLHPPSGCHYEPLCPLAQARCRASYPPFVEGAPNHGVACHLVEPL